MVDAPRIGRRPTIGGIACALAVALMVANADADTIELVSGERIEGKVVRVTDDLVYVETGSGVVLLPRHTVRSMGSTPAVAPPAAPAADVITALKGLQAAAASQVSQKDYAARVAQSRPVIAKYVQDAGAAPPGGVDAVRDAFALYEFAATVWESRLADSAPASAAIGRSALIDRCPALQKVVADYPPATDQETAWRRGVAIEFEIPRILTCASEKAAEAERVLKR
jgi:hypothetical protein